MLFESYGGKSTRTFDFENDEFSSAPPQQVNTYWGEILVFWAKLWKSENVWLILLKSKKPSLLILGLRHWCVPQGPFFYKFGLYTEICAQAIMKYSIDKSNQVLTTFYHSGLWNVNTGNPGMPPT